MRYVLGIDSGGSKTSAILDARCDGARAERWYARVGNTNHHTCGPEDAKQRIARLISGLSERADIELGSLDSICFAGAGIDSLNDQAWVQSVLAEIGCRGRIIVCSDAVAALAGANGTLSGGMVLSGTGSIALGIDRHGACIRVGGWGYKLDDAGSGYGTAILGLRAAFEAVDGRGRETAIGPAILDRLGLADMHALLDTVYSPEYTPDRIAKLASCVSMLHGRDPVADEILDLSADALVRLATTLADRLGFDRVDLGLCGGMLENVQPLTDRVLARLETVPHIGAHLPLQPPVEGALIVLDESEEDGPCITPANI